MYETGIGTQRVGEYFASHGFVTIAPDFLGYGQSDKPVKDSFEDRFLTYTTVIDLLSSLKSLNTALTNKGIKDVTCDDKKISIWAHSNGGQIALTVAEVTGFTYPLVL
jgi:alpha-beta hydrolase superfamily lysophospholipase